jgi:hypothetical protein
MKLFPTNEKLKNYSFGNPLDLIKKILYDFTILEMGYLQRGFLIYLTQSIQSEITYGI